MPDSRHTSPRRTAAAASLASLLAAGLVLCSPPAAAGAELRETDRDEMTVLDRYVARPDPAFAWSVFDKAENATATTWALRLTSQTWRTQDEVSHPAWTHWLHVCVPKAIEHDTALLIIAGGRRRDQPSFITSQYLDMIAGATRSVVVLLDNVPNQPLELNGDGQRRSEDNLLAESWLTAFRTGDINWVAHLAMVKSAVAAMDAAQAFAGDQLATDDWAGIGSFVLLGGSKRGWTSWLTAAVDARVRGIMPIVIDTLNLPETIPHHFGAYGFFSQAIHDYADRGLPKFMESPRFGELREIVDPFVYRERLTMPKLVVNAAGDEYFLPDSPRHWYHDLLGDKALYIVPNTDHGRAAVDGYMSLLTWYWAILNDRDIPKIDWALRPANPDANPDASPDANDAKVPHDWTPQREPVELVVTLPEGLTPGPVTLWTADNQSARDFREEQIGKAWAATTLRPDTSNARRYTARVEPPAQGFRAIMVTAVLPIDGAPSPITLSTEVFVIPDVLPFADKPME